VQGQQAGTWKGNFTVEQGLQVGVEYFPPVSDSAAARIRSSTGGESALTGMHVDGRDLVFTWGAFACRLQETGNKREGECLSTDGTKGRMVLTASATGTGSRARTSRKPDTITSEELVATGLTNLLEAVRKSRPSWLQTRPVLAPGLTTITVFKGTQRLGTLDQLSNMPVNGVNEVRFYVGSEAVVRYGRGYGVGVIEVNE
jgi:hypothetical protein